MAIAEELKVVIRAEVDKAKRDLQQFNQSIGDTKAHAGGAGGAMQGMGASIGKMLAIAGGMTALVATIRSIGKAALDAASSFEVQRTEFAVFLGDVEQGNILFERLRTLSASTPMQLADITKAAKQLISFGSNAADVETQIRMLGDASLGNAQKLDTLTRAFGRVQARGRASMEEVNMAMEAGLPIIDELAKQMGVTKAAVFELISSGKVGFTEWQAAFESMTGAGGQFENAMLRLSETFAGKLSTLKDNWVIFLDSLTNLEPLKRAFDFTTRIIQNLTLLVENNAIGELLRIIGEGAWRTLAAVFSPDNFGKIAAQVGRTFMAIIQANMQMALSMFDNAIDVLTSTADKLGEDWFKHLLNGIIRGATAAPRALLALLGLEGASSWRPFRTEGPDIGESFLRSLAEQGPEILETYKSYFQQIIGAAGDLSNALGDAVNAPVDEMVERIRALIASLQKDVAELESTTGGIPGAGGGTGGGGTGEPVWPTSFGGDVVGILDMLTGEFVYFKDAMKGANTELKFSRELLAAMTPDIGTARVHYEEILASMEAIREQERVIAQERLETTQQIASIVQATAATLASTDWSGTVADPALADHLNNSFNMLSKLATVFAQLAMGNAAGAVITIINWFIEGIQKIIRALNEADAEMPPDNEDVTDAFATWREEQIEMLEDLLDAERELRNENLRKLERQFSQEYDVLYDAWDRNLISTEQFIDEMNRLNQEYDTERADIEAAYELLESQLDSLREEESARDEYWREFWGKYVGGSRFAPLLPDSWTGADDGRMMQPVNININGDHYGTGDFAEAVSEALTIADARGLLVSGW